MVFPASRSPLFRTYIQLENGYYRPDLDSYYGTFYKVNYENFVSFLGDLREKINNDVCRMLPHWDPNDYLIGLDFILSDYGLIFGDERLRIMGHMAEQERRMYELAEEYDIDLRKYQAGRRLCLLPPEVVAIFGGHPEVFECVEEYQRGLDVGMVEWFRGPSPEVPPHLRRNERRLTR